MKCLRQAQKPWSKRYARVMKSKKDYHMACKLERTATNQENNARNSSDVSADQVETLHFQIYDMIMITTMRFCAVSEDRRYLALLLSTDN